MTVDSILLNGFVVLFLFFVFYKTSVVRPCNQINTEYLSLDNCLSYRGVAAIVVLLHHAALVNEKTDIFLFKFFAVVGYLSVAIFFFLSGYGVMKKYMMDENYEKNFLKKRMSSILIPYTFFLILYWLYKCLYSYVSPKEVLNSYITGLPIVQNSWYVVVIFFFYILFFLQMKIFKRQYKYFVLSGIIIDFAWIFLCRKLGYGIHWYNTTHVILIGFLWAMKEAEIKERILKHTKLHIYMVAALLLLLLFCFFGISIQKKILFFIPAEYLTFVYSVYTSIIFILFVFLFNLRLQTGNYFQKWIGKISFELYLIHGLFLDLFKNKYIPIESPALYVFLSLILSIVSAFLIHNALKFIMTRKIQFCEKKQSKSQNE